MYIQSIDTAVYFALSINLDIDKTPALEIEDVCAGQNIV